MNSLTHLGNKKTDYPTDYAPQMLESFANKHPDNDYWVSFDCPEFSAICPITAQPDYGKIIINYIPNQSLIESKSLKLYLFSFRNHGDFHENCVNVIMKDIKNKIAPKYIEVLGLFNPRGGISINPFANYYDPNFPQFKEIALKRLFEHK